MTSRPGLGIPQSLQSRGSGSSHRRRPSKPIIPTADLIDPTLEDERTAHPNGPPDAPTRPPPRGRPQLFYNTIASNGLELPVHSFPYQPTANLPVPPRPGSIHPGDAAHQRRIVPGGSGVKDPPKLTALEVVAAPVHFPGGKAADVFPWTGNNAEDTLTEALVKAGISNKPQIMNETNTARPSLWSNLKNKSGINSLTSLFVAVLEKRQQSGRLLVPNTFKPPPRLTLRDSTREGWLHDLANPTASMRRLSRTIPHGLTGKVLLEQCLNKNIPLSRAVWLAKCVGINELRAHKRKGHAGTVTWGRGWTSSVEQFLEGVMLTIGQGEWKPRMTYALQVATYFYKEHLLDADHFLDWIMNGLDTCPSERLFIWILVVSIPHYWKDIASCRRRGKRLAETLLSHVGKLHQQEERVPFLALIQHLETTLLKLLATRPACLLLPSSWAKYSSILYSLAAKRNHPQIALWVKSLDARNMRLAQSSATASSTILTPVARIYRKLDSLDYKTAIRIDDLSYECMEILANATQLISALLHWACSCYREGTHRTYLTVRLLRRWSHLGADVYEGITSYMREMTWVSAGEPRILCRVVAELVRSKHFPAGRYLQWLIATGSLGQNLDLSSHTSWPVRLVTEIPISGLSDQVRNLRSTLLRGTSHSAESEGQALDLAKRAIAQAIPSLFGQNRVGADSNHVALEGLSRTVKLELGIWLRQRVAQHSEVNDHVPTKEPGVEETAAISLITAHDFHIVRSWLEQFCDLAILADVVGIAASSLDPAVISTTADTLTYHSRAFRAIGALDPLFGRIEMRYAALRTTRYPDRELLLSLQNLTRTVQPDGQLWQLLCYDLSRLDQRNSIAACSPASDSMGEVMQHTGACSDDEIERILSSGTSMDQQMMARVLRKIISNLQDHFVKGFLHFDNFPVWFWRLRNFDEPAFDSVIHDWSSSCLMSHQVQVLRLAVPYLVSAGCMALSSFLDELRTFVTRFKGSQLAEASSTAVAGLHLLLNSDRTVQTCSPQDAYRYRIEQDKLSREPDARILQGIGDIVDLVASTPTLHLRESLATILSSASVLDMVKYYIISDPSHLSKMKGVHSDQWSTHTYLQPLVDNLLDPLRTLGFAKQNLEQQIVSVFRLADDLSFPICQAVIDFIFAKGAVPGTESTNTLSAALSDAVKITLEQDRSVGLQLLATLDDELTNRIRQHAEHEILSASAFLVNATGSKHEGLDDFSTALVQKYMKVVRLTSNKMSQLSEPASMLAALAERLKGVSQILTTCITLDSSINEADSLSVPEFYPWLNALMQLVVAHGPKLLHDATLLQQTTLMMAMKSLLTHPTLEVYPSITEYIFDAAVYLSDFVSDETRVHITRHDNARPNDDPRCHFILGIAPPVDGWLVLTKPVNVAQNSQFSSQPSTPVTLPNQASPFQSPQLSSSGPGTPQQRYFNQQQRQQMQQAQQMRSSSQSSQQPGTPNRNLPAQLQRAGSSQQSAFQQMQQMQQLQGFSQQRATQPSPIHSQRPTPAASQSTLGGPVGGAGLSKLHNTYNGQQRELRQYPFAQPRWELLADTSVNSSLNETSISLSLFGARKV